VILAALAMPRREPQAAEMAADSDEYGACGPRQE